MAPHTHESLSEFNFNKELLNEKCGEIASHKITPTILKWSFNNYVDMKRGEGVSSKSTLGHVTKVFCKMSTIVHSRGEGVKIG